jgi:hypothetical protein
MNPINGFGDVSPWSSSPEAARKDDEDEGHGGGFARQLSDAGRKPARDDRRGEDDRLRASVDAPWQAVAAFMTPMPALPAAAAAPPDATGPREQSSSPVQAKAEDKADKPGESKDSADKVEKSDKNDKPDDAKAGQKADQASDQKSDQRDEQKADAKADLKAEKSAGIAKTEGKSAETVSFKPTVEVAAARQAAETMTMQVTAQASTPVAPATATPLLGMSGISGAPAPAIASEAEAAAATASVGSLPPDADVDAAPERGHIGTAKAEVVIGEGADKLSVRISAAGNQVRVEAAAASAGMALMIQRSSEELRAALSRHGLELRELGSDATDSDGHSGPTGKEQPTDRNEAPRIARQSWRTVA